MSEHFWPTVPNTAMRDALQRYYWHGDPLGSFLEALVSNRFVQLVGQADSTNIRLLIAWAHWLWNDFDAQAWGSEEKVAAWRARGGALGPRLAPKPEEPA